MNKLAFWISFFHATFWGLIFGVLFGAMILGCGHVKADGALSIQQLTAPDGSQCYALFQGSTAIGGSCR